MVAWWLLLIPTSIAIFGVYKWCCVARDRDLVVRALQIVETEYRLMSQNSELFRYIQQTHEEMKTTLEQGLGDLTRASGEEA